MVNVSEGRRPDVLAAIGAAAAPCLLDVHTDASHHRSVFTLAGDQLEPSVRALAEQAVARLDLREHTGAHPRLGVLDVVPFVALPGTTATAQDALRARDRFVGWAAETLALPCFLYGPERSLPEVRRSAWSSLRPDAGPSSPHPSAGAVCVGARSVLVAYNVWLHDADVTTARRIAAGLRGPAVRALGLDLDGSAQVSCNLIDPLRVGPMEVFDRVASQARVARSELVGLVPRAVLDATPVHRRPELDLSDDRTIEARLSVAAPTGTAQPAAPTGLGPTGLVLDGSTGLGGSAGLGEQGGRTG